MTGDLMTLRRIWNEKRYLLRMVTSRPVYRSATQIAYRSISLPVDRPVCFVETGSRKEVFGSIEGMIVWLEYIASVCIDDDEGKLSLS
ncbi:hypothetical protein RIF29_30171 [Crotalaria pallida]|uniref:Uncharacterized protein n=1 Tax=Crotalaria pallida TaxID=3830 RepID=A0AAN9EMP8_CROPI